MIDLTFKGRRLYRIPARGKIKGVCAGLAEFLDIPVQLVRVMVVLSLFFGVFIFTAIAYFALAFLLDEKPDSAATGAQPRPCARELLDDLQNELRGVELPLREMERYVTSETFSVRSRFRQL
ncbi:MULTISPECIES: envelope stress response membrane protein PspC [unclassified Erwinia]|uniref:envelope stress response membrane protein PspC n=1 Tax=unclassified Erwinia TaxID=2622719 RepID=UPI000836692E|nr:envelope stress response membrane protein PspC [Erwinia sp. ErVv1]